MKRSIQTHLFWAHSCLFLLASAVSVILTWLELAREDPSIRGTGWTFFPVAAAASAIPLLLLGAVSWWITRRALAPVVALTHAAEHIHEGSLKQKIPLRGTGDELDRLASVLNEMMVRLDSSFQKVREFTLHASHELKTPLTILRNDFEKSLTDPSLGEGHRDRLYVWLDEVERLNRIVSGLTLLLQADAHQVELVEEEVDLAELLRDAAGEAAMLGQSLSLKVVVSVNGSCHVRGDRHRLRQLLLNLTDNAVKYNRESGYVNYSLFQHGSRVEITVESGGRGIDPVELPKIFDRFFRSGNSRGSVAEGCGLGLSISKWIAEEHGGTLTAHSAPDRTTLTLSLPQAEGQEQPSAPEIEAGNPGSARALPPRSRD